MANTKGTAEAFATAARKADAALPKIAAGEYPGPVLYLEDANHKKVDEESILGSVVYALIDHMSASAGDRLDPGELETIAGTLHGVLHMLIVRQRAQEVPA